MWSWHIKLYSKLMPKKKRKLIGDAKKVLKRLEKYEGLSFLERYAIFMMRVQTIELLLKRLLAKRTRVEFDEVDKYTALGSRFLESLKDNGMQDAIIEHLIQLKEYRDYFAHEFLVNLTIVGSILKEEINGYSKPNRQLFHALFTTEQFLLLHEEIPKKQFWKAPRK